MDLTTGLNILLWILAAINLGFFIKSRSFINLIAAIFCAAVALI